ncbi:uncharacterized protein LOC144444158 [Glandiceps talaboti]
MANRYGISGDDDAIKLRTEWARKQIHAILGAYDGGHSFVIGYGYNPPLRPHHRGSSCPVVGGCGWKVFNEAGPNHNLLIGAVVGGPGGDGVWEDDRKDFKKNEVAVYYNSGFQAMLAGLIYLDMPWKAIEDFINAQ